MCQSNKRPYVQGDPSEQRLNFVDFDAFVLLDIQARL